MNKRQFLRLGVCGITGCAIAPFCSSIPSEDNVADVAVNPEYKVKDLWKWSKEGYYYAETPRGTKCMICPNECVLKLNEESICRNRINVEGKIYSIAYGNPCAVHVDPIEKKPLYHFYPESDAFSIATAGCNLSCLNCQNWSISQVSPKQTKNYDLMPDKVVEEAKKRNCKSIAYTYSEPITFYEYTYDTAKIARQAGIKNVMVTAGYINEKPLRNLSKYIDAANVDLKSFNDSIYLKLNDGKLQPVLNTLKILKEENVWLEITNLIIPSWTDDFDMIKEMCEWLNTNGLNDFPLHFSRFHPSYKITQLPPTPTTTLEKAREIALKAGIKYVYIGNVPGTSAENTYCPQCHKTVIERRGYRILKNLIKDGDCSFCGTKISGVWS